jgi:hypothetical protein
MLFLVRHFISMAMRSLNLANLLPLALRRTSPFLYKPNFDDSPKWRGLCRVISEKTSC